MRITIPTTGSRGDVQPFIALGIGLQKAGHRARLATHADFESMVRGHGLDFYPIEDDAQALQASSLGTEMLRAGSDPFLFIRQFVRLRLPLLRRLMTACHDACADADVILVSTTAFALGLSVAEKLRVPLCVAGLQPTGLSRHLPSCLFPEIPAWVLGRSVYNWLTHIVGGEYLWQLLRKTINETRREVLGLPALPFFGPSPALLASLPTLFGFSPLVVPRPPDWPASSHVTGYWFLDAPPGWQPPHTLTEFLEKSEPPVYIGFGSMHNEQPEQVTELVVSALERTGLRAVLLTGWGGLVRGASERVCAVDNVPHSWLFPRTAAVVHHGGAGTTAAAFRAGVPALVVPFMSDQPFWARRTHALGVGPAPVPRKALTVDTLAAGLEAAVGQSKYRSRAADLGAALRAEQGVDRAVEQFHTLFDRRTTSRPRNPTPERFKKSG